MNGPERSKLEQNNNKKRRRKEDIPDNGWCRRGYTLTYSRLKRESTCQFWVLNSADLNLCVVSNPVCRTVEAETNAENGDTFCERSTKDNVRQVLTLSLPDKLGCWCSRWVSLSQASLAKRASEPPTTISYHSAPPERTWSLTVKGQYFGQEVIIMMSSGHGMEGVNMPTWPDGTKRTKREGRWGEWWWHIKDTEGTVTN